jgi:hypothetical protein
MFTIIRAASHWVWGLEEKNWSAYVSLLTRDHALAPAGRIMKHTVWLLFFSGSQQHGKSNFEGFQKVLYILYNGMTMKKLVMFAVNVRKIKALTVMEQWHWLVKADRIWHALCMCMKLIAEYIFFADAAFGGGGGLSLYQGCFAFW